MALQKAHSGEPYGVTNGHSAAAYGVAKCGFWRSIWRHKRPILERHMVSQMAILERHMALQKAHSGEALVLQMVHSGEAYGVTKAAFWRGIWRRKRRILERHMAHQMAHSGKVYGEPDEAF